MRKLLAILVIVVVYGAFMLVGEVNQFPNLGWLLLFSAITLVGYGFRALRWKLLMDNQKMRMSFFDAFRTYIAGLAFVITPGKMGEVAKAELMKDKFGFRRKPVVFTVIIERIFDVVGLAIIGLIGAAWVAVTYIKQLLFLIGGVFVAMFILYFFRSKIKLIESELEKLGNWKLITICTLLSLVAWGFEIFELVLISSFVNFPLNFFQAAFAFTGATLIGNAVMTPGGIGAAEVGLIGILLQYGMTKPVASLVTLTIRITTLWFGFFLGAFFWMLVSKQKS
ncbi:MAG: flippase-like domain-containing protein [Candidatus Altiarchaeota archaeon]|nr:flippase-like domain-containing protein [Candidatus Altiarchaeota archaeon]